MRTFKRIAAAAIAAAMLAVFAGCGDQSWSYRTSDVSLTAGDYIYNLLNAYYEAYDKVESPDEAAKILDEEVEDSDGNKKTVEQYSVDNADKTTLKMLAVESLFKQYGLELDQTEYETNRMYVDQMWGYNKDMFEGYGISQDSFTYCSVEYNIKYEQVFDKLYGADGEKAVSDEELTKYFFDTYMGYAYFSVSMADYDEETGESIAKPDDEFTKTENSFDSYVDMINKDGKSYEDTVKAYMKDFEATSDPTLSGSIDPEDNTLNETVFNALNTLDKGKATYVKSGEGATTMYYFVYRPTDDLITDFLDDETEDEDAETLDIADTFDTAQDTYYVYPLKSGYNHHSLLSKMKSEEFDSYLDSYAASLTVEKNSAIINKFKPTIFVQKNSDQ